MEMQNERKKRKGAVALTYKDAKDSAPHVAAKGRGILAEKIIEAARESGVPIHEDPGLLEMLIKLECGHEIPGELYSAVAEVLAYIRRISQ